MSSDRETEESIGVFDTLLMPLRVPGRVVADVGTLARGVGELVEGVRALEQLVEGIDDRVQKLESLEATMKSMMEDVREDLNARMGEVQEDVHAMLPMLEKMGSDVAKIDNLLPDPSDGPLTRLKDTFSSGP